MRLLKKSSPLTREYRTEVRVCPSGKSVDPKFLSSNDVLAHSRIVEEYASIRELIASVNTGAFVGTNSKNKSITFGLPGIHSQSPVGDGELCATGVACPVSVYQDLIWYRMVFTC
jgi:hypothetical protein